MFEVGWSEILVVGVVALIVVGPKELPTLLRTIGRYMGVVKRQAAEFRAQFDEAMRESELEQLRKDVENIKSEAEGSIMDAERSVRTEIADARGQLHAAADGVNPAHSGDGPPLPIEDSSTSSALDAQQVPGGAGSAAIAAAAAAAAAPPISDARAGGKTEADKPAPANAGA